MSFVEVHPSEEAGDRHPGDPAQHELALVAGDPGRWEPGQVGVGEARDLLEVLAEGGAQPRTQHDAGPRHQVGDRTHHGRALSREIVGRREDGHEPTLPAR